MSEEKKDFVIKDRRIFAEENRDIKEEDKSKETAEKKETEKSKDTAAKEAAATEQAEAQAPLPEINFSTFIISLNASALVQLGVIEDPASGTKVKNLPVAKQTIDILNMLEEKTRGNLTTEEENIIKNVLYDLRILYVKETG
jgi:hypothetical protein